jgi:hypothetical protein
MSLSRRKLGCGNIWELCFGVVFLLGLLTFIASSALYGIGHSLAFLICMTGLVVAIASAIAALSIRSRFGRLLENHDYLLCPKCEYPLPASIENGHCPECGLRYIKEQVQHEWKLAMEGNKDDWSGGPLGDGGG